LVYRYDFFRKFVFIYCDMRLFVLVVGILICHWVSAQTQVVFPHNRQVFQRNELNQATVSILGNTSNKADKIQVSFVPVQQGQGKLVDWVLLDEKPVAGVFQGKVVVSGGWYRLKVRSYQGARLIDSTELSRVGVGENFLIAGQSNAGGTYRKPVEIGAQDDRVNCANFYSHFTEYNPSITHRFIGTYSLAFPFDTFNQMGSFATIGPNGLSLHYWPAVGDSLVKKYNVPVCFINTGWGGSSIRNWAESARGVASRNPWVPELFYQFGFPYKNLSRSLEIYGQKMGFRAILWHQGETDAEFKMSQNTYKNYLTEVIKASRKDANFDIPWIVAQASRGGGCADSTVILSPEIRAAQKFVASDSSGLKQVFEGPNTDVIEVPRSPAPYYTCVHFSPAAFADLAVAWTSSIDAAVKKGISYLKPDPMPNIAAFCGPQNSIVLKKLNSKYTKGNWFDSQGQLIGSIFDNINLNTGIYSATLNDSLGREFTIPALQISNLNPPSAPSIKALTDTLFCANTSVNLQAIEGKVSYIWNTGSLEPTITVNNTGVFRVKTVDDLGCVSEFSKAVSTQSYPQPQAPTISAMSPYYLSTGQRILGLDYVWYLNGSKIPAMNNSFNLHVKASGAYQARASTVYPKGLTCLSNLSNEIIYQLPGGNGLVTYPNPVSQELIIQSQFDLVGSKYFVYGLDGREVLQGIIDDSVEFKVSVGSLNSGTYKLVIISLDLGVLQKTIVIDNH